MTENRSLYPLIKMNLEIRKGGKVVSGQHSVGQFLIS